MDRIHNCENATPPNRNIGMRRHDIFSTSESFLCIIIILSNSKQRRNNPVRTGIWTLTGSQTFYHFHAPSWQEQLELAGALSQLARRLRVIRLFF